MVYSKETLRQIFQQPFSMDEWQQMLQHYFQAKKLRAEPERIDGTTDDEQGYYLGVLNTTDNHSIGLFYYQIQRGNVARKRVGLRNLVKSFINPDWGEFDAALVVFDSNDSVWRLSFICDIQGETTAPKRFSYVFGESDNYYNTPVGRFDYLQIKGISFENIKDAFSVERVIAKLTADNGVPLYQQNAQTYRLMTEGFAISREMTCKPTFPTKKIIKTNHKTANSLHNRRLFERNCVIL